MRTNITRMTRELTSTLGRRCVSTTTTITPTETLTGPMRALALQPRLYARVHLFDKAYLVTRGDVVHLPVTLKQVAVGDTLALSAVSSLGSRDYTLAARPPTKGDGDGGRSYLDPALFICSATVIEHTKQPMVTTIKKKRRNRHAKAVKRKQPYTVLRITELESLN